MAITAQDVKKLRTMTGAGMMDCKKALSEAEGDLDKAVEILRKKGQKLAAKRADRETTEGQVFVYSSDDNSKAVALAFACETEPVSVNDEFKALGQSLLDAAVAADAKTAEEVLALTVDGVAATEAITALTAKMGEKMEISGYANVEGAAVAAYKHGASIAVLVELSEAADEAVLEAGRNVGMQVAAMRPLALAAEDVDPTLIAKEKEIGVERARQEGKPENILERIAEGYVKKFLKENTLLEQAYVKDPSQSVKNYVGSVKSGMVVKSFNRVSTGK
ncbi:elongation factor Ts [Flammeovirga yaeyamensis]|uniref:Elongation factor Ts n=1 Tax=Flammeovirga yaeyamensis TaxID=367791 RepID=A0AAX1N2Y4_9BACT|nr:MULTISPECIES: translation elongation factor Ts [Flammeovirga]ANQ50639.1 elongation factor Ts [Flammeovirga sp. MY04]MBB3700987.1 elongation factor Ts [Flammeovirga yaeyamensis]NMF38179.1 elongation factor Ts [Flammeovirga yaeyamensis]QWG01948.1 elongation factor Ts [Flammeovirga yaeyamensis]